MKHKHVHLNKCAEGCKPSAADLDLDTGISTPAEHGAKPEKRKRRQSHASMPASASTTRGKSGGMRRNAEENSEARRRRSDVEPADAEIRPAPGGYGGKRQRRPGRPGTARGPLGQTQGRFVVGDRVRNASGRGVWGLGTIVAVIPSGENPRWFCIRNCLPILFGRRSEAMWCERYIVLGDDGCHHVPRKVKGVS